jgi:hypothetical protein
LNPGLDVKTDTSSFLVRCSTQEYRSTNNA